jgi:hypothetical protein
MKSVFESSPEEHEMLHSSVEVNKLGYTSSQESSEVAYSENNNFEIRKTSQDLDKMMHSKIVEFGMNDAEPNQSQKPSFDPLGAYIGPFKALVHTRTVNQLQEGYLPYLKSLTSITPPLKEKADEIFR